MLHALSKTNIFWNPLKSELALETFEAAPFSNNRVVAAICACHIVVWSILPRENVQLLLMKMVPYLTLMTIRSLYIGKWLVQIRTLKISSSLLTLFSVDVSFLPEIAIFNTWH
ncbi:hypothetical protein TNIN_278811 [Trichonephila inaurata madagascariensis]|uniref:Uncharacterized protein n=1 Tax=Trichonephila inaurata madagascariensis TaxID=2747483 RepID=A0A8X6Y268_9ARAC|nr:hypothetical protein TNIN_41571 [Trichonephila inaurata madagascariensis]GFY62848.1 hypothetical protein TNIN_278811 [Trichonephila inaurata madagascariensis]